MSAAAFKLTIADGELRFNRGSIQVIKGDRWIGIKIDNETTLEQLAAFFQTANLLVEGRRQSIILEP